MMQPEMILSAQVQALTQLQNLSLRLSTALALDNVLDVILDAAGAICHADHIAISRLNAQSEMVILRQRGLSDTYLGARQLNRLDPTIGHLITTKAPYVLENLDQLAGVSPNYEAWKQEG